MRSLAFALATFLVAGLAPPVSAAPLKGQDHESRYLSDRFYASVGWFGADFSTDVSFGFGNNLGTLIRLESDLQLEDTKDSTLFNFNWRFNRKHALGLFATQLNRKGESVIGRQFEIEFDELPDDGLRFGIGARVESDFRNDIIGLVYRYSFYNNGKIDAGLSAGLGFYNFDLSVSGQAAVVDEDGNIIEGTGFRSARTSVAAPVPTIGINVSYAVIPRLIFRYETLALELEVSDIEGRITQTHATLEWFFVKHASIGGGITTNNVDVRLLGDDPFRVDYRYGGFVLFFAGAF